MHVFYCGFRQIHSYALAFVLVFVLVFAPTLTFARATDDGHRKHVPHFRADDSKVETTAQPRSLAKTPLKHGRKGTYHSVDAAINSMYRPFQFKGAEYVVSQIPGVGRRAKAQMIHGKDFEEILVDENNTGTASVWQVTRGQIQVKATHPYRGSFSQIDIREKRAKSFIHTHLQLNPDFKTYRIAAYSVEPFSVAHYDDAAEVQIMCEKQITDQTSLEGIKNLRDLLSQITVAPATEESALQCRMTRYQEALIDKSCYEGDFATGKGTGTNTGAEMAKGLAKIFSSVGEHTASGKPQYLQCLNEHGFAYNAAQMQSYFVRDKATAQDALDRATNRPADAIMPDPNSCQVLDQVAVYKNGQPTAVSVSLKDLSVQGLRKPFACDATISHTAEYNKDASDQISVQKNAAAVAAQFKTDAATGYAELMFHELLHQSGLSENSEQLVQDLEKCCASPDPSSADSVRSCNLVQMYTNEQLNRQNNENALGMYMPGYAQMRADAVNALGAVQADRFMGKWLADLQADPDGARAWAQLQTCVQADPSNAVSCNKAAEGAIRKATEQRDAGNSTTEKQLNERLSADLTVGTSMTMQVKVESNQTTSFNVDGYGTDQQTKNLASAKSIPGLLNPSSLSLSLTRVGLAMPAGTGVAVTDTRGTMPSNNGPEASPERSPETLPETSPETSVETSGEKSPRGPTKEFTGLEAAPESGLDSSENRAPTLESAELESPSNSTDVSTPAAPSYATGSYPAVSLATKSLSRPTTTTPVRDMNLSPKVMPLSTEGAVPASTGAYDPGVTNSAGPLAGASESLWNLGSRVAQAAAGIVTRAVSSSSTLASSVAEAQARAPASEKLESLNQDPSLTDVKSDENGGQASTSGLGHDQQVAAAIARFEDLKAARPDVVWQGLKKLGPETLARELGHPRSSKVVRTLLANGWAVRKTGSSPFLMDPKGKCFLPDKRKTLIPFPSCGR